MKIFRVIAEGRCGFVCHVRAETEAEAMQKADRDGAVWFPVGEPEVLEAAAATETAEAEILDEWVGLNRRTR